MGPGQARRARGPTAAEVVALRAGRRVSARAAGPKPEAVAVPAAGRAREVPDLAAAGNQVAAGPGPAAVRRDLAGHTREGPVAGPVRRDSRRVRAARTEAFAGEWRSSCCNPPQSRRQSSSCGGACPAWRPSLADCSRDPRHRCGPAEFPTFGACDASVFATAQSAAPGGVCFEANRRGRARLVPRGGPGQRRGFTGTRRAPARPRSCSTRLSARRPPVDPKCAACAGAEGETR